MTRKQRNTQSRVLNVDQKDDIFYVLALPTREGSQTN